MEIKDIRAALGYSDNLRFITKRQLARALGISDYRAVHKYLDGLEAVDGKYYLITDVARKMYERRKT